MIKKLLIVLVAFVSMQFYAQQGTASPYSYYGIGSLKFKGTVESRSMGGLSIYADSVHINLRNPASYAGDNLSLQYYDKESRPVIFSVGGSHSRTNLKSDSAEGKNKTSTFDYIALSIPIGKLGVGFGLVPYSSVGYQLEKYDGSGELLLNRFKGEGGLNRAYFSAGYQITKSLSFGVDGSYNFGNIKNSNIAFQYTNGDIVQYQTRMNNRSDLSGFNLNFGLLYKTKVTDKLELSSGITYAPQSKINSSNEQSLSTITISTITGFESVQNTIEQDLGDLKESKLVIPSKFSIGAGLGERTKWFAGVEYTAIKTSNFRNELYDSVDSGNYVDGSIFSVGGFFIPEYNSFTSYWKRIVYRAGFRFENTGLSINNHTINEFGMSFGLGLPMGNGLSNTNVGFEFGKRGTTQDNLVQENYFNVMISLSLNDRWFRKRKYD